MERLANEQQRHSKMQHILQEKNKKDVHLIKKQLAYER